MITQASKTDLNELERSSGVLIIRYGYMGKYYPEIFVAPCSEAEALGQVLLVFIVLAHYIPLAAILAANGLTRIEPQKWYPMQNALNVFKALYQDAQSPNYDLVRI